MKACGAIRDDMTPASRLRSPHDVTRMNSTQPSFVIYLIVAIFLASWLLLAFRCLEPLKELTPRVPRRVADGTFNAGDEAATDLLQFCHFGLSFLHVT